MAEAVQMDLRGAYVSLVQLCVPHYRVPFFSELDRSLSGQLEIAAGERSLDGPIAVAETPGLRRVRVPTLVLGHHAAIQCPLPRSTMAASVAVIEFNPRILSNLWILFRRRSLGRPTVLWGHGMSPRAGSPQWVRRLRVRMAQTADAVVFYNNGARLDFAGLGLPPEKLFVAPNALDVERIRALAGEHAAPRRHIVFAGRLIASKKLSLLIQGFARAADRLPPDTRLVLVGDGPERGNLASQAEQMGIRSRVQFAGQITDEELLAPLFSEALLAVSPGPVGLFAIHSLAYGVPMLLADAEPHRPEAEALVPHRNCEFFAAGDSVALADKLVAMLSDPDGLIAMGLAGIDDVTSTYSVAHMSATFLEAFRYVMAGSCPW